MNELTVRTVAIPRRLLAAIAPNHRELCVTMWERYVPESVRKDVMTQKPEHVAGWLDEFARLCKRAEKLGYGAESGKVAMADQHNFYVWLWSQPEKMNLLVGSFTKLGPPASWKDWRTFPPHSKSAILQLYREWSVAPGAFPAFRRDSLNVGTTRGAIR